MKRTFMFIVLSTLLLAPDTSSAHHSFSATYDTGKTTSIEGKVVQFLLRNPHSFLHVSVIKDGQEQVWNVEWRSRAVGRTLASRSNRNPVIVTGNPSRDPAELRLRMVNVQRTSDGANWGFSAGQFVN